MPRLGLGIHRWLEEAPGASAVVLGTIESKIGVSHQPHRMGAAASRRQRNADAGADNDLMTIQLVGLTDHLQDPPGEDNGVSRRSGADLKDRELVSPNLATVSVARSNSEDAAPPRTAYSITDRVAERHR